MVIVTYLLSLFGDVLKVIADHYKGIFAFVSTPQPHNSPPPPLLSSPSSLLLPLLTHETQLTFWSLPNIYSRASMLLNPIFLLVNILGFLLLIFLKVSPRFRSHPNPSLSPCVALTLNHILHPRFESGSDSLDLVHYVEVSGLATCQDCCCHRKYMCSVPSQ